MAWCVVLISLFLYIKSALFSSFGLIVCGGAMVVAHLGEQNPAITPLMPVLNSPLLSIHVAIIMTAYSLFAIVMLNSLSAIIIDKVGKESGAHFVWQSADIGRLILYPAVFLLTAGIFVGAVWANVSWGRYWGWDPKEVWALITLLVYSAALHTQSIPAMRSASFFHRFSVVAFFCVLFTYFGVNFLLGGLHGYA